MAEDIAGAEERPSERSDREILTRVAAGNLSEFERFVDRHKRRLFHYALHRLKDVHQAEDVAQEVFLRVFRATVWGVPKGSIQTWLFAIARNCIVDQARRNQRTDRDRPLEEDPFDPSGGRDPAARLILDEEARRIELLLAALPEAQGDVLALKVFGELSLSDIAEITASPLPTVKSRLRYALQKVHQLLGREEGTSHE